MSAQRRPLRSLADMLKGKQGRFRQNLLGKRVDYSGRSVIVVGPKLSLDECGVPKRMALELFRPFVLSEIMKRGLAHNIRGAGRVIEEGGDDVWAILEEVIKDKKVLLNRAPTLHRLSVQAFSPILVEGLAIQIPPLVCTAFNADFDGDQMAIHLPLSAHAQKEAADLMSAGRNLLKPATGELVTTPQQDMVLGNYYLTMIQESVESKPKKHFAHFDEAMLSYESGATALHERVFFEGIETTVGRLMFNRALRDTVPFVNDVMNKKKLAALIEEVLRRHGIETARDVLDRVKLQGFEMATRSGITWAMADLVSPPNKSEIIEKTEKEIELLRGQYEEGLLTDAERRVRTIEQWNKAKEEVAKLVATTLPKNNAIYKIIDSGARGSWAQSIQMLGMKGLVANPKGETIELPIKSSFKDGLSVLEYFISTTGARKGTTDTALKTAHAGYLTRRLVDVAQDQSVREEDCGTKEGIEIRRSDGKEFNHSFKSRLFSRTALDDIRIDRKIAVRAGEIISQEQAGLIEKSKIESVKLRSPIHCRTLYGICAACYGLDLGNNKPVEIGAAVGVVAAQSIGEPGTQLTMRTFHVGGVAGADITHGLPRVDEIFEARPPKGKAVIAPADGIIEKIEEKGSMKVVKMLDRAKKGKAVEFGVPRTAVLYAKAGDKVEKGDQLSEGNLDLRELLAVKGKQEVERYIINEVQKIYLSEGAPINNKHIEIIIRQMFARVKIKDSGDASDLVIGEVVDKARFLETGRELKKKGLRPPKAEEMLQGITRIALSSESFLSAASFQDTSRVLVKAAIEGKLDKLRGLKENVIIGRLLPTGAKSAWQEEREDAALEKNKESAIIRSATE